MNPAVLDTSARFLQAAASYFGVPPDQLVAGGQAGMIDGTFRVQLTIALTQDDLLGIANRMAQMREIEQDGMREPQAETFLPDDLDLAQLRDDYSALGPQEKGKYGSFARYKAARQAEQFEADGLPGTWVTVDHSVKPGASIKATIEEPSEGVGGRKVVHIDVPEQQDADIELPAAVWVADADVELPQALSYSDVRTVGGGREYLMQVDMLTPEQKAKYCGEQKP